MFRRALADDVLQRLAIDGGEQVVVALLSGLNVYILKVMS